MNFVADVFIWWLLSLLLAVMVFPITYRVFSFLPDRGLGFSRLTGLLLVSYVIWLIGFLHFSIITIVLAWLGLGAVSFLFFYKNDSKELHAFIKEHLGLVFVYESLFLLLFIVWCYIRMHHPEIVDQEKFMDFSIFNSIARASRFPPFDPWLTAPAGEARNTINYYYFGYYIMSTFARCTGVDPSVSYNLVIAFIYGLSGSAIFSLGYNLTKTLWPAFAGVAFLQVFGNMDAARQVVVNKSTQIDWWVQPTRVIHDVAKMVGTKMQYFNAWWSNTDPAFISKNMIPPDAVKDGCISEFPFFSFLHGDMHPHLVALPFALLALALALNLAKNTEKDPWGLSEFSWKKLLPMVPCAMILGCLMMINTWDLPAYGLAFSLCLMAQQHVRGRLSSQTWLKSWFLPSLVLAAGAVLFALPFVVTFKSPIQLISFSNGFKFGFGFTGGKTGMREALIFWGGFLTVLLPFLLVRAYAWSLALSGGMKNIKAPSRSGKRTCPECGTRVREGKPFCSQCGAKVSSVEEKTAEEVTTVDLGQIPAPLVPFLKLFTRPGEALADSRARIVLGVFAAVLAALLVLAPLAGIFWLVMGLCLVLFLSRSDSAEGMFSLALAFLAAFLIFMVEWVHINDTFQDSPALVRMNTVFKFYFQAWILLSVSLCWGIYWLGRMLFRLFGEILRTAYLVVLSFIIVGALLYPIFATASVWDTYVSNSGLSPTLNGADWLQRDYPDDYQAIMRLRQVSGSPVVAEAVGSQYTHFSRVASYTGLPTILGWGGSELQWRNKYPGDAQQDMDNFFKTMDNNEVQRLITKYNITYIFVGALERSRYSPEQLNKFAAIPGIEVDPSSFRSARVYKVRK